jgi:hypothetical protein
MGEGLLSNLTYSRFQSSAKWYIIYPSIQASGKWYEARK